MKRLLLPLLLTGVAAAGGACCGSGAAQREETYYEKHVAFGDATPEEKLSMAARLVPTPEQLAWQQWELTAFIHFTVNTFTDKEWGDGKESPDVFAPTEIDTDQWVETLRDAGFGMVMLTAKHHDGFCLWPTQTTEHSVKNSRWMEGRGDVVAMLRRSCDKYGVKMGLYVSPWDRNAACYGTGKAYDDFFRAADHRTADRLRRDRRGMVRRRQRLGGRRQASGLRLGPLHTHREGAATRSRHGHHGRRHPLGG